MAGAPHISALSLRAVVFSTQKKSPYRDSDEGLLHGGMLLAHRLLCATILIFP